MPSPKKKVTAASLRNRIAGTWKLMSAEDVDPKTGKWKKGTFGIPPSGYFIYDASGYASIQIMTVPPVAGVSPTNGPTAAQALDIYNGYIAYYGTWTVDAENLTVHVEGAWNPTQVGGPQARPYKLKGKNTLLIGDGKTYLRTLKRMTVRKSKK